MERIKTFNEHWLYKDQETVKAIYQAILDADITDANVIRSEYNGSSEIPEKLKKRCKYTRI